MTSSHRISAPQVLGRSCLHCGHDVVRLPGLGWIHPLGKPLVTSLALACDGHRPTTAAEPDPASSTRHVRLPLASGMDLASLMASVVPPAVAVPGHVLASMGYSPGLDPSRAVPRRIAPAEAVPTQGHRPLSMTWATASVLAFLSVLALLVWLL